MNDSLYQQMEQLKSQLNGMKIEKTSEKGNAPRQNQAIGI